MKALKIIFLGIFFLPVLLSPTSVFAANPPCVPKDTRIECIFGTVTPPSPIASLIPQSGDIGAGGISKFISNGIILVYSLAAVALIIMLLWGAFQWLTSGGDKEQLAAAQKRIMNAFIGIILFAVAFAIITVLGQFTGFKFFQGQGVTIHRNSDGSVWYITCSNGDSVFGIPDPAVACKDHGF